MWIACLCSAILLHTMPAVTRYFKLFGFLLLGVLLWRTDLSALGVVLAKAQVTPLLLGFLASLAIAVVKAIRWNGMLFQQKMGYPTGRAVLVYFGSIYLGLATPGRLGELTKALVVKRDFDTTIGRALSSVLIDRIYDFYALIAVGLIACFRFDLLGRFSAFFLLVAAAMIVAPILLFHPQVGRWFTRRVLGAAMRRKFEQLLIDGADDFFTGLELLLGRRLIWSGLLTAMAYGLFFVAGYCLSVSLNIPIGFWDVALVMGLANLLSLIPITVAGVGTRDAVFLVAFGVLGLHGHQALALSALVLALFYVACGLVGLCCFLAVKTDMNINDEAKS